MVSCPTCTKNIELYLHCKPKPCIAHRELPVSQFHRENPAFITGEPCSHCRVPVFITGISLYFPVLTCKGLQCISYTLLVQSLSSWLAKRLVWAETRCTVNFDWPKLHTNWFQPAKLSTKQVLRACCPNIYTVPYYTTCILISHA